MPAAGQITPLAVRFTRHIAYTDDLWSCWLWTGDTNQYGYGLIDGCSYPIHSRIRLRAHRVAWELAHGPIPEGLLVCHHCDTPGCVRPDHLFLGTNAANMADKVHKRRQPYGPVHYASRLTEADVHAILSSSQPSSVEAARYGVTPRAIRSIRERRNWKHITTPALPSVVYRPRGEHNPAARLTSAAVIAIRSSTESQCALARRYGVHSKTIRDIVQRRIWKHVA